MSRASSLVLCLAAGLLTPLWTVGCTRQSEEHAAKGEEGVPKRVSCPENNPLADYQDRLLDLAFKTASAIPVYPHIKDRSKAQEAVATTWLRLDQPRRALECIEKIENWRRGSGHADLAFYHAGSGDSPEVQNCLRIAIQESNAASDWRRDRIKAKVARVYALLGHDAKAEQFARNLTESETGKAAGARASLLDDGLFDVQMKSLEKAVKTGNFDITRNALGCLTEWYRRFYANKERRSLIAEKIREYSVKVPLNIQIEKQISLAEFALVHEDSDNALKHVNQAQQLFDGAKWPLRFRVKLMAKLAEARFRVGDTETAGKHIDAARAMFDQRRDEILNFDRAGILRPIAEAYQSMGRKAVSLKVYKQAVEQGAVNPNSRPRAEDLAGTCCSMALHGIEPDAELWSKIAKVVDGLGEPW